MAGFLNATEVNAALADGRSWISSFRKVPGTTGGSAGLWFDYSYAPGNPVANYYAASPKTAAVLDGNEGIYVPTMSGTSKQFLHRLSVMVSGANAGNQTLTLMDYLLYYPFIDMDAAGEQQDLITVTQLPRYTDGVGVQAMLVVQAATGGAGGTFTMNYRASDGNDYTTGNVLCPANVQATGMLCSSVGAAAGTTPFIPLNAGVKGIRWVNWINFSVANGGLAALVLVKPLDTTYALESVSVAGVGAPVEREALSGRPGMVEIVSGAFLGMIGYGVTGALASCPLVGTLETVWK